MLFPGEEFIDVIDEALRAPRSITLDNSGDIFCLVSPEDYDWLKQWKWSYRYDKRGKKIYAVRNTRVAGHQVSIYMHKAILIRATPHNITCNHTIGDHRDGNSLNNQRGNLRWATPRMNAKNRKN